MEGGARWMDVEGWKGGQDTESWPGVRTRFWVIAILVTPGARLELFGFAARTEADGIDIPSFCCQRGEQGFAAPSNCAALLSAKRDSLRGARRL